MQKNGCLTFDGKDDAMSNLVELLASEMSGRFADGCVQDNTEEKWVRVEGTDTISTDAWN